MRAVQQCLLVCGLQLCTMFTKLYRFVSFLLVYYLKSIKKVLKCILRPTSAFLQGREVFPQVVWLHFMIILHHSGELPHEATPSKMFLVIFWEPSKEVAPVRSGMGPKTTIKNGFLLGMPYCREAKDCVLCHLILHLFLSSFSSLKFTYFALLLQLKHLPLPQPEFFSISFTAVTK